MEIPVEIDYVIHDIIDFINKHINENDIASYLYNDINSNQPLIKDFYLETNILEDKLGKNNDCNKNLQKISTDFITYTFFSDKNPNSQNIIYRFQYIINEVFNRMCISIIDYINSNGGKLKYTDIIFLYKGGTTLKILYETNRYKFENNQEFYNLFGDNFKRSDSDYIIMINPYISIETHHITFEYIYKLTNYVVTNYLYNISIFMYNNILERIFEDNKLEKFKNDISSIINEYKKNNVCEFYKECDEIIGIGYIDSYNTPNIYISNPYEYKDLMYKNKWKLNSKFRIITKNIDNKTIICYPNQYLKNILDKKYTDINFYINDTIEINNNLGQLNSFCLQRTKINFVFYYRSNDDIKKFNCPGELIDIVILKQNSINLKHFYDTIDDPKLRKYKIYRYRNLRYNSYTITGHVDDLLNILFSVTDYPWNDNKYINRINRLIFLLIIQIYDAIHNVTDDNKALGNIIVFNQLFNNLYTYIRNILSNPIEKNILDNMNNCNIEFERFKKIFDINFIRELQLLFIKVKDNYDIEKLYKLYEMIHIFVDKFSRINKSLHQIFYGYQYNMNNDEMVVQLGGIYKQKYLKKYLKYKNKYLELKNIIKK